MMVEARKTAGVPSYSTSVSWYTNGTQVKKEVKKKSKGKWNLFEFSRNVTFRKDITSWQGSVGKSRAGEIKF